jgi:metal-responsive CopG/Arc/MetJ family transcriptional regulator
MSDDEGTTTGVWFGPRDADLLEEFDEEFATESRSEKIKDAMELYLNVEQTLDDLDFDMGESSKRHFVIQAIRDSASRPSGED